MAAVVGPSAASVMTDMSQLLSQLSGMLSGTGAGQEGPAMPQDSDAPGVPGLARVAQVPSSDQVGLGSGVRTANFFVFFPLFLGLGLWFSSFGV